jgi:hypothetical protein
MPVSNVRLHLNKSTVLVDSLFILQVESIKDAAVKRGFGFLL